MPLNKGRPRLPPPGPLREARRLALPAALLHGADVRGMSEEEVRAHVDAALRDYAEEFPRLLADVREGVARTDPVHLLAWLAFTRLFGPFGRDRELEEPFPFLQPHLELLQALVLQHPERAFAWDDLNPTARLDEIEDAVMRLALLFALRRWTPEQRSRVSIAPRVVEFTRGHTQHVRNWGYPEQIRRLATSLFAPLEGRLQEAAGVRADALVAMSYRVLEEGERRLRELSGRLDTLIRARTKEEALVAFRHLCPDEATEGLARSVLSPRVPLEEARAMMLVPVPDRLAFYLTFTPNHFAAAYPGRVDADALLAVLDGWSLAFGDLAERPAEHFFMGNPVWDRPLIRLTDRLFFLPVLGMLNTHCLGLVEGVVRRHERLWHDYQNPHRGTFLETETERLLSSAFPDVEVHRGVGRLDGSTGETDLLVFLGSGALIAEAKSGRVGAKARTGAELSLRDEVEELVVDPARQAGRFLDFLRDNPGPQVLPKKGGGVVTVDGGALSWTAPLTVTLDQSSMHYLRWRDLREEGIVPPDLPPAPVMSVADLECVLHLLEGPCQRVHYLRRRGEVELAPGYAGSELDLLAYYLESGFDDAEVARDPWPSALFGRFKAIDGYLAAWFARRPAERPRRRITRAWARAIHWLERRRPPGWLEVGCALLDRTWAEQEDLGRRWGEQGDRLRGGRRAAEPRFFLHAPPARQGAEPGVTLVLLSHRTASADGLDALLRDAVRGARQQGARGPMVVLGKDVERGDAPVSGAAYVPARRGHEGP